MKGYKRIFRCTYISLKEELTNIGFYIVVGLFYVIVWYVYPEVASYAQEKNITVNIWELYIWFATTKYSQLLYLMAAVCIGYQTFGVELGNCFQIVRTGRIEWVYSKVIQLCLKILLLNLVLLVSTWSMVGFRIHTQGEWSLMATMGAQFNVQTVGMRPVVQVAYGLLQSSANMIGVMQFLLTNLIGVLSGLILLAFSLYDRGIFGVLSVFGTWYADILITSEPVFSVLESVSIYGLARVDRSLLNYGRYSPWYAILFLTTAVLLMIEVIQKANVTVDYVKVG